MNVYMCSTCRWIHCQSNFRAKTIRNIPSSGTVYSTILVSFPLYVCTQGMVSNKEMSSITNGGSNGGECHSNSLWIYSITNNKWLAANTDIVVISPCKCALKVINFPCFSVAMSSVCTSAGPGPNPTDSLHVWRQSRQSTKLTGQIGRLVGHEGTRKGVCSSIIYVL